MSVSRVDAVLAYSAPRSGEPSSSRRRDARFDRAIPQVRSDGRSSTQAALTAGRALPAEIAFLASYGVPLVLLQYAAALARRQGASADAVLLAEGLVAEETFYRALAQHLGVDFLEEPAKIAPGGDMAAKAECGFARLAETPRGLLWLVAPRGAAIASLVDAARGAHGRPLFALTTPSRFAAALRSASLRRLARLAAFTAERADPELSARTAVRRSTIFRVVAGSCILSACLFAPVLEISLTAALFMTAMFLSSVFLRLFACAASFRDPDSAPELDDAALPHYSVVVALYREAPVASQLARAIDRIDYPRAKLDVKFVVECDDEETAEALRANQPRASHEIIVAPAGAPRTKPRALNVAAPFLRGSLVAIFDAEDLPEPDQLRRAAAIFAAAPPDVACLQASLCIDNGAQNWITALFAIDYALLFDVFDRGLATLRLPLFLGGSSNHFRLQALRDAGYWDAYNVTEDADLGLRLARAGYETRTFRSRTYEEAPADFTALLRQRTRWVKGWMQTAIVHCRRPLDLLADLGPVRTCAVLAMFSGGVAGPLLFPFLTIFLAYRALFGNLLHPETTFELATSTLWCCLALYGAGAAIWLTIVGMQRQRLIALWPALFFSPLWALMPTLAAWRALRELWLRPFHWEKTEHGSTQRGPSVAAASSRQLNSHCLSENPALNVLRKFSYIAR